ncbi:MAG: PDZ domain-containing protein, partial [candidate division NC10 bacterium]
MIVARVRRRSPAACAGLLAGDRLVAINGAPLRDSIDFHFQAGEATLRVELERDGRAAALTIHRRAGRGLGVELLPPRPAEISTCANKCVFCFIHQLPKGMRRSLYVKD